MPVLSKPATKAMTLKRPAASINDAISKMRKGVSSADLGARKEKGDDNGDDHDDENQIRDKSKGQKYAKMRNQLPEHVVHLIEQKSQKMASPRDFKTACINKLFRRNSSGKLELNLDDMLFKEHKTVYERKYQGQHESAMLELVMRGLYFNNDARAMDEAKAREEIIPVEVANGKTFCAFTTYTKGREGGSVEEQTLEGSKKVSKEQAAILSKAFDLLGWSWTYGAKDVNQLDGNHKIPPAIMTLVEQATASQQRLAKEAMLMIKNWKGDKNSERLTKLKKGHATISVNLAKLSHMKEFCELPDDLAATKENLDGIMKDMAVHTRDYNELVETTRGFMKSLKN
jgi:hypothetical protein